MNKIDIEEAPDASPPLSFFQAHKTIIIIVGAVGGALLVTGIVLAVVLTSGSSPEATTTTTTTATTRTSPSPASSGQSQSPTVTTTTVDGQTTTVDGQTSTATVPSGPTTTTTKNFIYERLNYRIDCVPWLKNKTGADVEGECKKNLACEYEDVDGNVIIPSCYYDTDAMKVDLFGIESTRLGESYALSIESGFDLTQVTYLKLDFEYLDDNVLRFKIYNPSQREYEVPIQVNKPKDGIKAKNPNYEIIVNRNRENFYFKIVRKSTQTVIWDTSMGPIVYDQFNRMIATYLPTTNVYGFGENKHESFKHDFGYKNWPIFNRDEAPENVQGGNLYGSQPFYTCLEPYGKSHGVALVNSNAMEYEFVPNPGLIYRTTGGVFDFYVFLGPEPENVVQQFTQYFGRTFLPPYWALGFAVSRYGYEGLGDMVEVYYRCQAADIPMDIQVADIDHFDERADFTIDPNEWLFLPTYFSFLHDQGLKTVLILDPAIPIERGETYWPYTEGRLRDVFIRSPRQTEDFGFTNSTIMVAACWPPGPVAYPDFFKKSAQEWWINSILRHHKTIEFDGIWIDMNDPAAFGTNEEKPFNWPDDRKEWSLKCPDDDYELVKTKASYVHKDDNKLSDKTICMEGLQGENNEYKHFDVHNLYGHIQLQPTYEAARLIRNNKRGLVYSRSTFLGSGKYGGHWTGDNHSRWSHLYYSIIGMLEFNLFGIPYVGADICGFFEDTTVELCARWSSLGAFYPFSRNHNGLGYIEQDPAALGITVATAARNALQIRYQILPYYYTLFYKAHLFGNTVARPLFHEFPRDLRTHNIDKQFLIGPAFLVTPVLEQGAESVLGYFPPSDWYDYYTGKLTVLETDEGKWVNLPSPIDHIPLHIRGGYIIPTQQHALTTTAARLKPFGVIVAPDRNGNARGDLFYDDGETDLSQDKYYFATFSLQDNVLRMDVEKNNYADMSTKVLDDIRIFVTLPANVKLNFIINDQVLVSEADIQYDATQIVLSNLNLPMDKSFTLEWEVEDFWPPGSLGPIIDCSLDILDITQAECQARRCLYFERGPFIPKCFIPETAGGYTVTEHVDNKYTLQPHDALFELFPNEVNELEVTVTHGSALGGREFRMTRLIIQDPANPRYEVPVKLNFNDRDSTDPYLEVNVQNNPLSGKAYFEVKNALGMTLFDTKRTEHGLAFYDQFIQIVLNLRDYRNLYGFGENSHPTFKHKFSYDNWYSMFSRDEAPGLKGVNLYGVHPFFMAVDEKSGRCFGVLIFNSNAQEYGLLPPHSISYRTTGGELEFYIMEEETPERLTQAYHALIGLPYMPPYWAMGFQLSRWGYNRLINMQLAINRTLNAQIPLDVQHFDIDTMYKNLDFTYNTVNFSDLPIYVEVLQEQGIRVVIILDPAIDAEVADYLPSINGKNQDVFIKWPAGTNPQELELGGNNPYVVGYVWPEGKVVFPDFMRAATKNWWINEIKYHHRNNLNFDGIWLDMNEPSNFGTNEEKPDNWVGAQPWSLKCPQNTLDDPAYKPLAARPYLDDSKRLSDKTICMNAVQGEAAQQYSHYNVHSLYGWSQTQPSLQAMEETMRERSLIITRSTYPSSGKYAGHWLGDNRSRWSDMKASIIGIMEFNLFGIPYVGADVCGFYDDATPELCARWMQLGAFYSFYRNHNSKDSANQDPASFTPEITASNRKAVELRYSLIPYLYTLFYDAYIDGGTVIRSLMHEFPRDTRALAIDRQFMWGAFLLISPVLEENARSVQAYFPGEARWFDYYTGIEVEAGRAHEIDAPLDHIPLHVRGGAIIVTQDPAMNTELSRLNPYRLLVTPYDPALYERGTSSYLYHDTGETLYISQESSIIDFTYTLLNGIHTIRMTARTNQFGYEFENKLASIRMFGVEQRPSSIKINNVNIFSFEYNSETKVLVLDVSIVIDRNLNTLVTVQ